MTATSIISRCLHDESDWWRVRDLLIETYPITPTGFNWEIRRWDGSRFHNESPAWKSEWGRQICLWETEAGQLVGVVHPDYPGDASLQLHADFRRCIEEDMIAWAETHLSAPVENTSNDGHARQLDIDVYEYDSPRQRLLEKRGYEKMTLGGVFRRLRFGKKPLPQPAIAEGYIVRTTRPNDPSDAQHIADILNAAFNRSFHTGKEVLNFMTHSPSFSHDLDLAAEAPDGSFAAYISLTYEPVNRYGVLEPVCTHPDHQRKGLARALILQGLRRIRAMGAMDVYVGTGHGRAANHLYEAVGFDEAYTSYVWRRVF